MSQLATPSHLQSQVIITQVTLIFFIFQNPTWRSLDFGMLPDLLNTSASCFIVRIWGGQEEQYMLLIEWKVNLDGLRYTGQQVSSCVIFQFKHYIFLNIIPNNHKIYSKVCGHVSWMDHPFLSFLILLTDSIQESKWDHIWIKWWLLCSWLWSEGTTLGLFFIAFASHWTMCFYHAPLASP